MTNYPNRFDDPSTLPTVTENMGIDDKAIAINALIEAVEAIEEELGITPSGTYINTRVRLDILESRINNELVPAPNVENPFIIGNDGVTISVGAGVPAENRLPGSLYLRTDGYSNEGLYSSRPDGYWHLIGGSSIPNNTVQTGGNYGNYLLVNSFSTFINGSTIFIIAESFEFDPSIITAANGTRNIKLKVIAATSGPQLTVQLFNFTTNSIVTGGTLTTTSITPTTLITGDLTANLSATNAIYQIQIKIATNSGGDFGSLYYATLRVDWS